MFCLLCHEKVPRLRAWRTKSEFCCDEHAEIYKRQTLERLLTDQEEAAGGDSPPLPVESNPAPQTKSETVAPESSAAETLARFAELDKRAESPKAPLDVRGESAPAEGDSDEGVRELWRLAEEVGPGAKPGDDDDWAASSPGPDGGGGVLSSSPFGNFGGGSGTVSDQSPEEALAALRELSGSRRSGGATLENSVGDLDTLLPGREAGESPRAESLDALDDLDTAELPPALGEALPDEDSLPPLDMGALEPLDDDELPSILDRLTESDSSETELQGAGALPALTDDPEASVEPEDAVAEEAVEEIPAEEEQPAAAAKSDETVEESVESIEPQSLTDESGAFDLLEEAVEAHLEEREEKPAESSRKVVPFPLTREKPAAQADKKLEESRPAASSSGAPAAKSAGRKKGGKGKPASDLSRFNLKPVAVMFGIEPSLCEPASGEEQVALNAAAQQDGMAEPAMCYPDTAQPGRSRSHLPVFTGLFAVLPAVLEIESRLELSAGPDSPDFAFSCAAPLPLVEERTAKSKRSLGSERAWMVRIEPELIEASEFEVALPNGDQHSPWLSPQLPAALLTGVALGNGTGKLDLSGSGGSFAPPVDRLCLVLPELGELGGSPKQSSSKAQGDELSGWMPPTVLDPRFDVERPVGRDLSDFG